MKKRFKNKLYISTLAISLTGAFAGVATVALPSSSLSSSNNEISDISQQLNSSTVKAAGSTDLLAPWNIDTQNLNNLDSPIQNMAFNNWNSQYALITTNSTTYNNSTYSISTSKTNPDYNSLSVFKMSEGSTVWSKQASEITVNSTNSIEGSKFVATSYVSSYLNREAYYLAVIKGTDNNYYLAFLKESDGSLVTSKQLNATSETTSSPQFYINVVSSTTLDINVYEISVDKTKNSLAINLFDLVSSSPNLAVSDSNLSVSNNFASTPTNLLSSYFYKNNGTSISSKITKTYTDNDYIYFVFQQDDDTISSNNLNNYVTILRLPISSHEVSISSDSFYSISLTISQFDSITSDKAKNRPSVSVASNGNDNTIILSSANSSTYLYATINSSMFNGSTVASFNSMTSIESAYIVSVSTLYTSNSIVDGYIALLSTNKAIKISLDFSSITLLYDFNSLNASSSKLIFNLFTITGDVNWYAQMTDGKIIQFNGSNLIGQLGSDTVKNRTENSANVFLLPSSEIPSQVLFQKVSDDNSNASESFKNYIKNNVLSFLSVKSYDTAFGAPSFDAEVKSITKNSDNNYSVSIQFTQNLRKITSGSIVTNNPTSVVIATQTYTFINADSSITVKSKDSIPAAITSKLPSEITSNYITSILNFNNVGNYTITLEPNDAKGILNVQVKSDAVWVDGSLKTNYIQNVTVGSEDAPYFKVDLFNGLSSSIDLVTDDYLNKTENATLKTTLTNKYSSTLPSEVTAKNIIDDFLVFGAAFNSTQLIANGLIQKPTENNVQLYPMDSEGKLYVIVTIPKIGDQTNVTYSFDVASLFKKDFTTNHNVYLNFLSNDSVLEKKYTVTTGGSSTETALKTLTPSSIVSLINSNKSLLFYFMDMSNYVFNILANLVDNSSNEAVLTIAPSDPLGTITFTINFKQQIPGLDSSYSCIFSGFTTANTNLSGKPNQMPGFSWGTLTSTALNGKKPADITSDYLVQNQSSLFVYVNNSNQLNHEINVTPLNGSGAVLVTITFYDWWENQTINGEQQSVKLAQKTFSTVLKNGLSQSKEPINSVVWKSFYELTLTNSTYTASTASNAVALINSAASTDLEKLKLLTNLSDYLSSNIESAIKTDPSALSLSIVPNDTEGTLSIYSTIKVDGETYNYSNVLSGFNLVGANYSVTLAQETSDAVAALKNSVPSDLTTEQIESLINVSIGNGLTKNVQVSYDDLKGTVSVTVNLYKDGQVVATTTRDYSGFKTSSITYNGTNVLIVVSAVIIPIVLLLTPILYISLFKNRRDIKRISKVLDKRLSEQAHKKKSTEVNTIADLLNLETEKNW